MYNQNNHRDKPVELADVLHMHGVDYCRSHKLTSEQYKVIHAIQNCRTATLGGHVDQCDHCGDLHISYNSCRNRHCPKCQSLRTLKWLDNRRKELLPVQYFHMVFTLPHELNNLMLYNKKLLHGLLFQAAWEAIKTLGKDPKRLGGQMGMLAILHTWGQNLLLHNHLHCIVPGGALTKGGRWKQSKKGYLFPVKVVSKIFRGIYVSKLRALYKDNKLKLPDTKNFNKLLDNLMEKDWVVYAKEPFAGPEKLLDYLGRYTHKIAISNNRILACDQNSVTFKWRDYSDNSKEKIMKLHPDEFIRRFLHHIVPKRFMRIRSFGFLANASKAKNIEIIRKRLSYTQQDKNKKDTKAIMLELMGIDITICPNCKKGNLCRVGRLQTKFANTIYDTS
jgi:hypothetical protein